MNINKLKKAFEEFLPHYLEVDFKIQQKYHYTIDTIGNPELRFDDNNLQGTDLLIKDLIFVFSRIE